MTGTVRRFVRCIAVHEASATRPPIGPRLVRPHRGSLKHLLHDQFWELVGGPSRGEMDCFAALATTEGARGNGNSRRTSTTSARVIDFWASPYSASSPFF
jgi:hypothetical protein